MREISHNLMPHTAVQPLKTIHLLGQPVHVVTEREAIEFIVSSIKSEVGGWVATHNLDHLRRLVAIPSFSELCATASLRTADGKPLIWASKLRGTPLPERVAGSDMTFSLTEAAAREGLSIFLLGGNEGTADQAARVLKEKYPGLKIAGTYYPPFGFERDASQMQQIFHALSSTKPDITYVAIGSPKQEELIQHLLKAHPKGWYMGVGISLAFVTGEVQRAPGWMRATGLEWVHRLCQEPGRLARRYLVDGIPFALKLLTISTYERFTRKAS